MLTAERLERALESRDVEDAARIIAECGYTDMLDMPADEIETVLAARREAEFSELIALSPENEVVDIFRLRYDYHNAKALIKANALGVDASGMLSRCGRFEPEKFAAFAAGKCTASLPPVFAQAIESAANTLAQTENPQFADFELDRAYFSELLGLAVLSGSAFLRDYVRLIIDIYNLRAAVRALKIGIGAEALSHILALGGSVGTERILSSLENGAVTELYTAPLKKAAELGLGYLNGGSAAEFECGCDEVLSGFLKRAVTKGFGDAVVIAYLANLEREIIAVRAVLTGRKAGLNPSAIRESLRGIYA